mgnify:CR=1 FL=1
MRQQHLNQIESAIDAAFVTVQKIGTKEAETKDLTLMGFGWLGKKIDRLTDEIARSNGTNHGNGIKGRVRKHSPIVLTSGGIVAFIAMVMRQLAI